jgi:hypothetical protein
MAEHCKNALVYSGIIALLAGFWFLVWQLSHVVIYALAALAVVAVITGMAHELWTGNYKRPPLVRVVRWDWTAQAGLYPVMDSHEALNLEFDIAVDLGKGLI